MTPPRAFISYAWEDQIVEWVANLAKQLVAAGIDIRLDQWHLKIADDLPQFMEESIASSDFVLIVCTPTYAHKANHNIGGVGYEGSIIKGALLTKATAQTKFAPLLRLGTPAEAVPRFLWNRVFLDFTDNSYFDESIEKLARHIYGRPKIIPPLLGRPPAFAQPVEESIARSGPQKWMLVAGTGDRDKLPDELDQLAQSLGRELAQARLGLVTGGWKGVDRAVSESFAGKLQSQNVPLDNYLVQVVEKSWEPAFKAGRIEPVPAGEAEYIESVRRADAAILIGGLGGTYKTGEYMRLAGKPVFPVSHTGGDARRFYRLMSQLWHDGMIPGVSRDQFELLGQKSALPEGAVLAIVRSWMNGS